MIATLAAVDLARSRQSLLPVSAAEEAKTPANGHKYPSIEKTSADAPKQYKMSPEFQAQVKKLPPEFIQQFKKMTAKHTRYSEDATARQVMMELLSDIQCVTAGLMVENGEMAADCAIRASRHRWPKGHLLAYVKLEQINADSLATLPTDQRGGRGRPGACGRNGPQQEFPRRGRRNGQGAGGLLELPQPVPLRQGRFSLHHRLIRRTKASRWPTPAFPVQVFPRPPCSAAKHGGLLLWYALVRYNESTEKFTVL